MPAHRRQQIKALEAVPVVSLDYSFMRNSSGTQQGQEGEDDEEKLARDDDECDQDKELGVPIIVMKDTHRKSVCVCPRRPQERS